ncbi:MAG: transcriptional repressor NrdR [Clostridia bacterium]|nr:transcriptional repressor NrdR [Clostridia bacterium]
MKCLRCGSKNTKVLDSRLIEQDTKIRRRRECADCKFRFTTFETYEKQTLYVIKNSGKREEYDRAKLVKSLKLCFAKRMDDESIIEDVVENFERKVEKLETTEIKTDAIGSIIMEELKEKDLTSCFIYACNLYNFKTIEELETLMRYLKS